MLGTNRRTVARLVLLALVAMTFAGAALAQTPDGVTPANEGICDPLQGGTPGLYGLCVAFCEAQDCAWDTSLENPFQNCKPASKKVLDKYNSKRQAGDPVMPCLAEGSCPCFTQAELEAIPPQDVSGQYSQCDVLPPVTNIVGSFSAGNYAQVNGENGQCLYAIDGFVRPVPLDPDAVASCTDLLVAVANSSPYCP